MSKAVKFYAVALSNGDTKILTDWDDAKAFIATCPSKAQYKKHPSENAAQAWIDELTGATPAAPETPADGDQVTMAEALAQAAAPVWSGDDADSIPPWEYVADPGPDHAVAFIGGAYDDASKRYGYSIVLFPSDDDSKSEAFTGTGTKFAEELCAGIGELKAAMQAVSAAIKHGYKRITICYSFASTGTWSNADYKIGSGPEAVDLYAAWMRKQPIDIKFVKRERDGLGRNFRGQAAKLATNAALGVRT